MTNPLVNLIAIQHANPNLWDYFVLPHGFDKQEVIDNIIMETIGLSISASEPKNLQFMIGIWSRKKLYNWTELYKTLQYKYNPIENYNRTEEWVDRTDKEFSAQYQGHFKNVGDKNGNDTRTPNLTTTTNTTMEDTINDEGNINTTGTEHTTNNDDITTVHTVYGFNVSDGADAYKDVTNDKRVIDTNNTTDTHQTNERRNNSVNDTTEKNTGTEKTNWDENYHDGGNDGNESSGQDITFNAHKAKMFGNIGVTTTQQMIKEQRELVKFNIIDTIVSDFKQQFCLLVY